MNERTRVAAEPSSARALEALGQVAAVHNTRALEPFLESDPAFFEALADGLRDSSARYEELESIEVEGDVDQDEGHPFLRVRLSVSAEPGRAFELRREIFRSWLGQLYAQAPLELRVSAIPT